MRSGALWRFPMRAFVAQTRCCWRRSEQDPSEDNSQAQSLPERDERKIKTLRISGLPLHCRSPRCAVGDQNPDMAIRRAAEKARSSHMQTQRCENLRDRHVPDMSTVPSVLAIFANESGGASRQR